MTGFENSLIKTLIFSVLFGLVYAIQKSIGDARRKARRKKSINFQELDANKSQTFYSNGILESQGEFNNNIKNGKWKYWDEEGVLIKEEEYYNGLLLQVNVYEDNNRVKQSVYNNGILNSEGLLINNKKDGAWKVFNEEEFLIKEEIYVEGSLKEVIEYEFPDIE